MPSYVSPTRAYSRRSDAPAGVIGLVASAGGIPALIEILKILPADFALPMLVAQHLAQQPSSLAAVLSWRTALTVCWAEEFVQPQRGRVYLVPPGTCVTLTDSGFAVLPLAPVPSAWLPSGDRMLHSLVQSYGARTVAVVLSGMLPAGVNGVRAVRASGGVTMAQDADALAFEMPSAAIDIGRAEIVGPPAHIASALRLVAEQWGSPER